MVSRFPPCFAFSVVDRVAEVAVVRFFLVLHVDVRVGHGVVPLRKSGHTFDIVIRTLACFADGPMTTGKQCEQFATMCHFHRPRGEALPPQVAPVATVCDGACSTSGTLLRYAPLRVTLSCFFRYRACLSALSSQHSAFLCWRHSRRLYWRLCRGSARCPGWRRRTTWPHLQRCNMRRVTLARLQRESISQEAARIP